MKKYLFVLIFLLSFSMKSFSFDNYYKMLEVSENATQEEIKKGYRRMAMKYHPDKHGGSAVATDIFKKIKGAYDLLSDPEQRAAFDKELRKQPKIKTATQTKPSAQNTASDNAKKHTWENFDQKKETPKTEARPEREGPKTQTKTETPKADTYEFKARPSQPNPTPKSGFQATNTEKAFKGDVSVVKPAVETRTPFKNPKLDIYNAPSCGKEFLGTVIDTLI